MTNYHTTATVTNNTGNTITSYWILHKPKSSTSHHDYGFGTSLANGQRGNPFGLQLDSDNTDVWNVAWVDEHNNLFVSEDYEFSGSARFSQNDVMIKIGLDTAEIQQNGKTIASNGYHQVGSGENTPVGGS